LAQVLRQLPRVTDKDLLVGFNTADDAGVYKISDDRAIITTLDFFPPIVDDPYTFGQIAAANSLSDVYAMGGVPMLAMNIVGFPKALDMSILGEILKGGMDKMKEADVLTVGGHSVEDSEVKYGLSVTGFVHPDKILTNAGAREGDKLILTKPIGVGIITSALKAGKMNLNEAAPAIASMTTLNKSALEAMSDADIGGCTDITGYGLLGHAMEMCEASGVNFVIDAGSVPIFPRTLDFVKKKNLRPKTIASSREALLGALSFSSTLDKNLELVLFDPQTSGGLFVSVADAHAAGLLEKLKAKGLDASIIGSVVSQEEGWRIKVDA